MATRLEIIIFRYTQAQVLRHIRKSRKLKSKDVANAIGRHPSYLTRYETGDWGNEEYDLYTLLNYYDIGIEAFVNITVNVYKLIADVVLKEQLTKKHFSIYNTTVARINELDLDSIIANIDH